MSITSPDYIQGLRALIGHSPVNLVGVSGLVQNERGELLLQRRSGADLWSVLGGLCELGEAPEDTLCRELREEAQIEVHRAELLTVLGGPEHHHLLANGDEFYSYSAVYAVREWSGTPTPDGIEGAELRFFAWDALPARMGPVGRRARALLSEVGS